MNKNIRNTLRDFSYDFSIKEANDNPEYQDAYTNTKQVTRMPKIT